MTMNETPLSIVLESIDFDSELEKCIDAKIGDELGEGEPDLVTAMEIEGEQNYGVEEQYMYMFRLLMPRWFPTPKPTSGMAAGGAGPERELEEDGSMGSPSESVQLAHCPPDSYVSSSWWDLSSTL